MSEHTRGPWIVENDRFDGDVVTTQDRLDTSMSPIATVQCDWDEPFAGEQRANLQLITAAPELLAALECQEAIDHRAEGGLDVLKRHGWNSPGNEHLSFEDFVRKMRRAAIAKATGAQP